MSAPCEKCKHYEPTAVFELCTHKLSEYVVAERKDFHTIGHMKTYACHDGKLFAEAK